MARGYGMALLAAISVVYLIHSSSAQTNYTVGDTTGWIIPPTGAAFYSTWAANKAFKVGDILIFNFAANIHDVVKVTKADYDACSASNPISSSFTPPVRITINASGDHYFFCSIGNHCSSGQKLMISASDASPSPAPQLSATPAPQPSTPSPSSSPSPASTPPPASTPAPATSPPASTPAPATSPPASTPAPATSPPASTPAPATSPPASTPPPTPAPGTSPPPTPAPGTSPPPTPAPGTTPPPTTAAPPPNSAASLGFAGFTTFLSIFVALCY